MQADVVTLEKQLNDEYSALSTQDCANACRALASIRRAAERICTLEPGPRCSDARTKEENARKRVSEACPDCAIAATPGQDDARRASEPPAPPPPQEQAVSRSESAPRKGGCLSCSTPGGAVGDVDLGLLLALGWIVCRRRRK